MDKQLFSVMSIMILCFFILFLAGCKNIYKELELTEKNAVCTSSVIEDTVHTLCPL